MKTLHFIVALLFLISFSCSQNTDSTHSHDADGSHQHDGEEAHSHDADGHNHDDDGHGHSHDGDGHDHHQEAFVVTDTLPKQTVAATDISPEYVQLATGLRIVPSIEEAVQSVGVLTHEGVFGPLLFAERSRAFFIELKPGMFLSEHPHPKESLVYTVKGRWVLCSEGKRQVMDRGSLFHFGDNIPTGWEAPFAEGALLLVVKTKESGADYGPYMEGLRSMAGDLDQQRQDGTMEFYYNELPADHPAIEFARSVNPDFDNVLSSIQY